MYGSPVACRFVLLLLAIACCAGCASDAPRRTPVAVATPETVEQLRADARESERVRRWIAKKRLCREHAVRFDSSARCW
ncbi:MAG TPA: hypothetical protein VND91_05795 [Candidatus Saccharimonadia bacterium]|nr:hypothetical protein [Candidatus Saccharimonadia bacterium]